ncbi:MAG: hypothetical protein OXC91_07220 [Rhodobacteraceae bacterium]|nr:hypothetical protein [Paracoccaceae bacterium]
MLPEPDNSEYSRQAKPNRGDVRIDVLSNSGVRVNSSGLAVAGYRVVCEVFAGALAGLLHDGALWLRPLGVRERIVGGLVQ